MHKEKPQPPRRQGATSRGMAMAHAIVHVREDEQRRFARDVHDDLGQLMGAMQIDLDLLRARIPPAHPALLEPVADLQVLVDTMRQSVRRIIAGLAPHGLEENGLAGALDQLARGISQRHGLAIRLLFPPCQLPLACDTCTALFRMVQEALNNVVRHARASRAEVCLRRTGQGLLLVVRDNGIGISPADLGKPGSYGLACMRERAAALGGSLRARGMAGRGTVLLARFPLALP